MLGRLGLGVGFQAGRTLCMECRPRPPNSSGRRIHVILIASQSWQNRNPHTLREPHMLTHRPLLRWSLSTVLLLALMGSGLSLSAQDLTPYGAPITLDRARTLIAAAEVEAKKQNWPVVIAIVDSGGHLVALARMDNTQLGSVEVAIQKATCSVLFRRPTKVFEDGLVAGGANNRVLKAPGVLPIEGGVPIVVDGRIIGAIGVSGVKPTEDGQVAQAALLAK